MLGAYQVLNLAVYDRVIFTCACVIHRIENKAGFNIAQYEISCGTMSNLNLRWSLMLNFYKIYQQVWYTVQFCSENIVHTHFDNVQSIINIVFFWFNHELSFKYNLFGSFIHDYIPFILW